jgi:hypothetical protein
MQATQRIASTSEAPPQRKATKWDFSVPAALIENSGLFTPAEILLALAILRVGKNGVLTDETWHNWSGKHARIKEMAINGLSRKGFYRSGMGNKTRFRFERSEFESWVKSRPRHEKARTAGTENRKPAVKAEVGMPVHADCRATGCAKLCGSTCEPQKVVSIESVVSKDFAQPVAQSPPPWTESLAAIRKYFPHVDMTDSQFLPQLLLACKGVENFTDTQLAHAIHAAKTSRQHSEGLFLRTVPARLAVIAAQPTVPGTRQQTTISAVEIRERINTISSAVKKQGMEDLASQITLLNPESDLIAIEEKLCDLELQILKRLRARTPVNVFKADIDKESRPHRGKMSPEQLARFEAQLTDRKLLEVAGIPRLTIL